MKMISYVKNDFFFFFFGVIVVFQYSLDLSKVYCFKWSSYSCNGEIIIIIIIKCFLNFKLLHSFPNTYLAIFP